MHFFSGISFLEDMTMTQNKCTTPLATRTSCLRVQRINPAGRYEDGLDRNLAIHIKRIHRTYVTRNRNELFGLFKR